MFFLLLELWIGNHQPCSTAWLRVVVLDTSVDCIVNFFLYLESPYTSGAFRHTVATYHPV